MSLASREVPLNRQVVIPIDKVQELLRIAITVRITTTELEGEADVSMANEEFMELAADSRPREEL